MQILLLLAPIGLPLLAAAGIAAAGWRPVTAAAGLLAVLLMLTDAAAPAPAVLRTAPAPALAGLVRADALSVWMLLVMAAVATLACWASPGYLRDATTVPWAARWYGILLYLFIAAMTTAVLAGNLGVLWVAVEATTIVTAFLVGHHRSCPAREAAGMYVVICLAAIAIAFLGIVLLYFAARTAGLDSDQALDWSTLAGQAGRLDPGVTRIAIGLAVLGFGAKAGLVPLHAWLPDAHSQAPAPVSALMSGVLLSVAFYAVLRFKVIADGALGPAYLRTLLLVLALATLAVAAVLLVGQRDYKRMLAYSSMEHIGLMAVGAATGTRLAIAAVLLHVAGHGLAKTVAFLGSGHILHRHGSSNVKSVRGLASSSPLLGGIFGLAMLALLGFPPAAVFASELGIATAGSAAGLTWAVAVAFGLVLLAFVSLVVRTGFMLLGPAPNPTGGGGGGATAVGTGPARFGLAAAAPLIVGLAAVAALGTTSWPVDQLLRTAATIVAVR